MNKELFRKVFFATELEDGREKAVMLALAYLCKPGETRCRSSDKRITAVANLISNRSKKLILAYGNRASCDLLIDELEEA